MGDLKTEINGYLFLEFGVEGDESSVSVDWPFELRKERGYDRGDTG